MILSQARVDELLKIFDKPNNISPYNYTRQKKEVENTSKFVNNNNLYSPQIIDKNQNLNAGFPFSKKVTINKSKSINSQNPVNNGQSTILLNNIDNLENQEDIEIHQSIFNLKNGQQEYVKNKEVSQFGNNIYPKHSIYPKYNPNTQSISAYEYQKNESILNSILGNSNDLATTQYLYDNKYEQNYEYNYNNYNNYNNYSSYDITNSSRMKNMNYRKPRSLKDIPSHPEDVIMTEIPPNLAISMNPISSSNLGGIGQIPIINPQTDLNQIPQELNQKPRIIEEINTDIVPNDNIVQNQQTEEPVLLDSLEPVKEPEEVKVEEEVKPEGKFKITEFNGPVKVPPNYSTDDEDEFDAIQILNSDKSDWKLQVDKDGMKVYSKLYKITNDEGKEVDNIMFYTDATVNFPASEINKQLYTYSLREKWDKSLQKGKLIKEEEVSHNLIVKQFYAYIKMPFIFSDRDIVLKEKLWKDYQGEKDCTLCNLKSIEHPDYPAKEKPVRAEQKNFGRYVKPISDNQCKMYVISKFDMKLSAPISMMEGKGSEGQLKSIKEFLKHCGN